MRSLRPVSRPTAGFSLVELMVALTVGMIIVLVVAQFFISTRGTYLQSDATGRINESGRFAIDTLASEIRMAGYSGCGQLGLEGDGATDGAVNNIAMPSNNDFFKFKYSIRGYQQGGADLPPGMTNWDAVKAGTSAMLVQRAESTSARLGGNVDPSNANIQIKGNMAGFKDDEILMITNCTFADIFRVNSVSAPPGTPESTLVTISHPSSTNTQSHLSRPYAADSAQIMRLSSSLYYVGSGVGACPENTLCRVSNTVSSGSPTTTTQTLVSNVEDMDLVFGVDTSTNADNMVDKYATPTQVSSTQWGRVVSVQVNVLLRSEHNKITAKANQSYWYNGALVTPTAGDKYLRRGYSQLVTLRNRTP